MQDRTYTLFAVAACSALAIWGIFGIIDTSSFLSDMKRASPEKVIADQIPEGENSALTLESSDPRPFPRTREKATDRIPHEETATTSPGQILTKQSPGEEIGIEPSITEQEFDAPAKSPKELTDRIPDDGK